MKFISKVQYAGYGSYPRSATVPTEYEAYNFMIGGFRYHYFHLNKNGKLQNINGLDIGKDIGKLFDMEFTISSRNTISRAKIISGPFNSDSNI